MFELGFRYFGKCGYCCFVVVDCIMFKFDLDKDFDDVID